jgi:hypothetical protein
MRGLGRRPARSRALGCLHADGALLCRAEHKGLPVPHSTLCRDPEREIIHRRCPGAHQERVARQPPVPPSLEILPGGQRLNRTSKLEVWMRPRIRARSQPHPVGGMRGLRSARGVLAFGYRGCMTCSAISRARATVIPSRCSTASGWLVGSSSTKGRAGHGRTRTIAFSCWVSG